MWSGFSGHSQASPGSGRHGLGWVSLLRARLLELGSAGLRFRPALRKRACLRGAPRAVPPSRVLLPSARAALVKSRDMHWSLLAQRGQRDVSLSSLRMLLVADGANPCESARPSRRHALWGCEHGGRDQSSVTCNRALVTRVLATEFESGFNTVERRHVPESRLFLRNAPSVRADQEPPASFRPPWLPHVPHPLPLAGAPQAEAALPTLWGILGAPRGHPGLSVRPKARHHVGGSITVGIQSGLSSDPLSSVAPTPLRS